MTDYGLDATDNNRPIVVAVDGSAVAYQAVAWAAVDAAMRGLPLRIVNSISVRTGRVPGATVSEVEWDWLRRDGQRVLDEASRAAWTATPGEVVGVSIEQTIEPIIPYLLTESGDSALIVVGSRGLGALNRGLLGSVSTAMVQHATSPVAVIHSTAALDPLSGEKPVLVGVDGTENSAPVLEFAFREAAVRKVGLVALHAWSDFTGPAVSVPGWDVLAEAQDEVLAKHMTGLEAEFPDVAVRRVIVRDKPVRALVDASENTQLVVVGGRGRGGFQGMLLGSTGRAVVHSVACPVVVVRQP